MTTLTTQEYKHFFFKHLATENWIKRVRKCMFCDKSSFCYMITFVDRVIFCNKDEHEGEAIKTLIK